MRTSRSATAGGVACLLILSCLAAVSCRKREVPLSLLTGIYTSMEYHGESGDTVGAEFIVVYSNHGYFVLFQPSEGYPETPVLVPATITEKGGTIEFTVPEGVPWAGTFRGTITREAIDGTFGPGTVSPHDKAIWHLPRGRSWWDGL